jgi:hypothetical protein
MPGGKYNLSLEGSMSRDKILKACELMELELRGQTTNNNNNNNNNNNTAPPKQERSTSSAKQELDRCGFQDVGVDRRQIFVCESRFDIYSGDV